MPSVCRAKTVAKRSDDIEECVKTLHGHQSLLMIRMAHSIRTYSKSVASLSSGRDGPKVCAERHQTSWPRLQQLMLGLSKLISRARSRSLSGATTLKYIEQLSTNISVCSSYAYIRCENLRRMHRLGSPAEALILKCCGNTLNEESLPYMDCWLMNRIQRLVALFGS